MTCPVAAAGEPSAQGFDLPPDPAPPTSAEACAALYADYRAIIDDLKADARACNAAASTYAQTRYGRQAGEGECARRVIQQCRGLVDDCARAAREMDRALARCRANIADRTK